MIEYDLKINGISPLMQNNPASMLVSTGKTRSQTDLAPADQARTKVYLDENDRFVHPVSAFKNAFIAAGKKYKIGRTGAATYLAGAMLLAPDYGVILGSNGLPAESYEIDVRSVVMPSTRGRVIRGRPRFDTWGIDLQMSMNEKYWPGDDDLLYEIFEYAGQMIGVGEGRPEKRALAFGKFEVSLARK